MKLTRSQYLARLGIDEWKIRDQSVSILAKTAQSESPSANTPQSSPRPHDPKRTKSVPSRVNTKNRARQPTASSQRTPRKIVDGTKFEISVLIRVYGPVMFVEDERQQLTFKLQQDVASSITLQMGTTLVSSSPMVDKFIWPDRSVQRIATKSGELSKESASVALNARVKNVCQSIKAIILVGDTIQSLLKDRLKNTTCVFEVPGLPWSIEHKREFWEQIQKSFKGKTEGI